MVFSPLFIAATLLPLAAQAANDWNKPCFGQCSWNIGTGKASGTVHLVSGSPSLSLWLMITDVRPVRETRRYAPAI